MKKLISALCIITVIFCAGVFSGCDKKANRTAYQIEASIEENVLTAKMSVDFYNHSENVLKELKFNLFANAFRQGATYSPISSQHELKAYPNGKSYGELSVNGVSGERGALEYQITGQDKNVLTVKLKEEVFPSERVKVTVDYALSLANVIARTGYNDCTVNLANFYPVLCALDQNGFYECVYYSSGDPFYSDCADYKVKLSFDKAYVVAHSGKRIEESERAVTFSLENARSVAVVLSEKFSVKEQKVGKIDVKYYYYDDLQPDKAIEFAKNSLNLFSQKFGEYAYSTYSVVQTKFVQGGMEFPSLVMISDDLKDLAYGEVIVHETAHQWWQTAVGNNEIEHGFLDEGLAEYSVIIFFENYPQYGHTRQSLIKSCEQTYKVFCSVINKLSGNVNTAMLRSLKDFSSEYEYVCLSYIKPCLMYDTLRKTIGDKRFFSALKKYYADYSFKNATPYDLMGAFEKVGADSNGFFESFYQGKEVI